MGNATAFNSWLFLSENDKEVKNNQAFAIKPNHSCSALRFPKILIDLQ